MMFAVSSGKLFQQCVTNAHIVKTNVPCYPINFLLHTRNLNTNSKFKLWDISIKFIQDLKFQGTSTVLYRTNMKKMKASIQKHYLLVLQQCCKQMEFILAHRLRRCQQIILLYSKWWDELQFKLLLENMRKHVVQKRRILLSSSIVTCLSTKTENNNIDHSLIKDSEFSRYSDEINRVYFLKGIPPKSCLESVQHVKHVPSPNQRKSPSCKCSRCRHGTSTEGWSEIYNKDNLTFWKKEHLDHKGKGLYCYKVYGYFTDITAEDFLQVQINVDFRKEWDQTAIELDVLERDEQTQTDVIYWELRFPRFFTNRDYVFLRRCKVDEQCKVITIINQSTSHASCPPKSGKHRVKEFWSYMVIKPTTDFDKPGLEFVISYFDNPGIRMPAYISSWLTFTEMPDFISRQRKAAILWSKRRDPLSPSNDHAFPSTQPSPSKAEQSSLQTGGSEKPAKPQHNSSSSAPSYYQMVKNSLSYITYMFYSS